MALSVLNFSNIQNSPWSIIQSGPINSNSTSISSSGQFQTIIANGGIYISKDYGNTWTLNVSGINAKSIAISSTGQYQTYIVTGGYIYISNDYGSTWTQQNSIRNWYYIAVSSSGQYQTAIVNDGYIYISNDYGNTWTEKNLTGFWYYVAISASGQYQTTANYNSGQLVTSNDYGNSWVINQTIPPISRAQGIAMSSSGQYQYFTSRYYIHKSTNYGVNWTSISSGNNGLVTVSSTGQYIAIAGFNQSIIVSSDYGYTFNNSLSTAQKWRTINISSSGQYIIAGGENIKMYTCFNTISGSTGSTGPTGSFNLTGLDYSNYIYWNSYNNSFNVETNNTIHIGSNAGFTGQNNNSVAIGSYAGQYSQGISAISIGNNAGQNSQGDNSIAIGQNAGVTNQVANSIILNASSNSLDASTSGFFVNPISNISYTGSSVTGSLYYIQDTSEIRYDTTKTFVIDHPINPDKYLVHSCLEGPEAGVYYRGKGIITNNKFTTVILPDYVSKLAYDLSVQITHIYNGKIINLSATEVENNQFKVYGENCKFWWNVYGKRGEVNVEPNKNEVNVKGTGPYKWI